MLGVWSKFMKSKSIALLAAKFASECPTVAADCLTNREQYFTGSLEEFAGNLNAAESKAILADCSTALAAVVSVDKRTAGGPFAELLNRVNYHLAKL